MRCVTIRDRPHVWYSITSFCFYAKAYPGAIDDQEKSTQHRSKSAAKPATIGPDPVEQSILVLRDQKVIPDEQLAGFYEVETRQITQAVKRNPDRFPTDFMFQLSDEEWEILRSQSVISNPTSRGGRRYAPYAFTEQGVAMLSSVLRSPRAVEINIEIMRAFVRLRQVLSTHKQLAERVTQLEQKMEKSDTKTTQQIEQIMALLQQLFNPPQGPCSSISFHTERKGRK